MANPVNPPPFLKIPKDWFSDREKRSFVEQQNTIIFQLWQKLGGNADPIADIISFNSSGFSSQVQWLQKQLNGLPELTCDTSGFTTDLTFITTDKVIA